MKKTKEKLYEQLGNAHFAKIDADNRKMEAWANRDKAEELRRQADKDLVQAEADWDKAQKQLIRTLDLCKGIENGSIERL